MEFASVNEFLVMNRTRILSVSILFMKDLSPHFGIDLLFLKRNNKNVEDDTGKIKEIEEKGSMFT